MVSALSRLGAVVVIVPPEADTEKVRRALEALDVKHYAAKPERRAVARGAREARARPRRRGRGAQARGGLVDMEAIDPETI